MNSSWTEDFVADRWLWISEPIQVGSAAEEQERAEIVVHDARFYQPALN